MTDDSASQLVWADALTAALLLAVDMSNLGGAVVRARAGPVRDRWLEYLESLLPEGTVSRRLPIHADAERLLGGLDLTATLASGKPVSSRGLLAESDNGLLVAASAERMSPETAALISGVLQHGEILLERDGIADQAESRFIFVALDEGVDLEETVAASLADNLAFSFALDLIPFRCAESGERDVEALSVAREVLPQVTHDESCLTSLCAAGLLLGIHSSRPVQFALRAARALAALEGRKQVDEIDLETACRLVLLPRATQLPANENEPEEQAEPEPPPENEDSASNDQNDPEQIDTEIEDRVVESAKAIIPADLLKHLVAMQRTRNQAGGSGRAGEIKTGAKRGRPAGIQTKAPYAGARPKIIDTLRMAAPWQPIRRKSAAGPKHGGILVEKEDFRFARLKHQMETATIFVVDASGSAAIQRLAEAKGAVELMLADCYVRRDHVAVISFRRQGAEILLPPTRSLTRAKRALAALPGGGGTPLSAGVEAGFLVAEAERRSGRTPTLVFLTDGRTNIAHDGTADRDQAMADALTFAGKVRASMIRCLLIDTSPRPDRRAQQVADAMNATYIPLPRADAARVNSAVRAVGNARA